MLSIDEEPMETDVLIAGGGIAGLMAALERKETRGMHRRSDFPFTNPLLQDKFLTLWQENGQVNMAWRDKS